MTVLVGSELAALDGLAASADDNARDERLLARSIRRLRTGRAKGRSWQDLLSEENPPGTLWLLSQVLNRITRTSAELRLIMAQGLQAQGATVTAIAARFGVTRQRVSALLNRSKG